MVLHYLIHDSSVRDATRAVKSLGPEVGKNSGLGTPKIGALLRAARDAVRVGRASAGQWVGASEGTIQNWEEAASPNALRVIAYMGELAARSDLAREFVLQILGLGEGPGEADPELERKLFLVRQAHGHESPGVRALFSALEIVLSENQQRNTA